MVKASYLKEAKCNFPRQIYSGNTFAGKGTGGYKNTDGFKCDNRVLLFAVTHRFWETNSVIYDSKYL